MLHNILQGAFSFRRYISSPQLIMMGQAAIIQQSPTQKIYEERGSYWLQGNLQEFYQKRIIDFQEGIMQIYKADQTLLHEFLLPEQYKLPLILSHQHHCGKDRYDVELSFFSYAFTTCYTVSGPQKNYIMHTYFTKL